MTEIYDHTHPRFVSYINKSRAYYLNKGYGNPYQWASHMDTPFTPLAKPLAQSRVGLITTAALNEEDSKTRPLFTAPTDPAPESLFTHHVSWHKSATHTDDLDSYFPINHINALINEGHIGSLSPRFYGLPTKHSKRMTSEELAPAILKSCQEDGVDVAFLLPL